MNALIIGTYGIFFLLVGLAGNAPKFLEMAKEDAGGFLPWAVGVGVLAIAYEYPATRKMAQPFIFLLILSFVLMNFSSLQNEYNRLKNLAS